MKRMGCGIQFDTGKLTLDPQDLYQSVDSDSYHFLHDVRYLFLASHRNISQTHYTAAFVHSRSWEAKSSNYESCSYTVRSSCLSTYYDIGNIVTVDSRYYDIDGIRKMYQYIQTINKTSINFYDLVMFGRQIWYRNKKHFDITDIVISREHCITLWPWKLIREVFYICGHYTCNNELATRWLPPSTVQACQCAVM
jgi:hypothetical protein